MATATTLSVLRFQYPDRVIRCPVQSAAEDVAALWGMAALHARDPEFLLLADGCELPRTGIRIRDLGLCNGAVLEVRCRFKIVPSPVAPHLRVSQDLVDVFLETQDCSVVRKRDPRFCRHSENGMCDYCAPLKPYDKKMIADSKIKHMSFHSYLRRALALSLQSSGNANSTIRATSRLVPQILPLSSPCYKVSPNCSAGHRPWPDGICSKCQPSAISLMRQDFRMVDHVEIDSAEVINNFLSFWRSTGCQRAAYMYGRYVPYDGVPLGVKAVVSVLFEPPQSNASDGLRLLNGLEDATETAAAALAEDSAENHVLSDLEQADKVAFYCGLQRVGIMFTDLTDNAGNVKYKRHENSFFLSSLEVLLAAHLQRQHKTPSRFSPSGFFGSRFVTCVMSGNRSGAVDLEIYQVSESAVAMYDAGLLEASTKPAKIRMRPSTATRYVPDVMYSEKNEFGANVQKRADPDFPVDYLLVNVTHGFPSIPNPTFPSCAYQTENRPQKTQSASTIARFLGAAMGKTATVSSSSSSSSTSPILDSFQMDITEGTGSVNALTDFHFLLHVCKLNVFSEEQLRNLCQFLLNPENRVPGRNALENPEIRTLLQLFPPSQANNNDSSGGHSGAQPWSCAHCTYNNSASNADCEMCGLPH